MTRLLIVAICLSGFKISAQILTIRVMDKLTKKPVVGAQVSLNKIDHTTTNQLGFFQIKAIAGDKLIITHIEYEELITEVPSETNFSIALDRKEESLDYAGGIKLFYEHFGRKLAYPTTARKERIQANVYVTFQIDSVGKMTNIRLFNDLNNVFADQISSVFQSIDGEWGKDYEKMIFLLPIQYRLANLRNKPEEVTYPAQVDRILSRIVVTAQSY